jgi:hypothetical protein
MKSILFKNRLSVVVILIFSSLNIWAKDPDYTGLDHWPTAMAFCELKNAKLIDNSHVDFSKTKTIRLASEKIGSDLFRQVHLVTFTLKNGETIEAITINNVSREEGSMSGVKTFVISKAIGQYP